MSHVDDVLFMERALALAARAAEAGEVPVGAVVVYEGRVLAESHNLRESVQDFSAHAELLAMREAARKLGTWRLTGCTVYVTLEPCPMCAGAMVLGRVDRCVYGASDPKGGFFGSLADISHHPGLNHRVHVTGGVLGEASGEALARFFRTLREKRRGG